MKHIFIHDLHGEDFWKEINVRKYDKLIFVGDYVDHDHFSDFKILKNLQDLIKFKRRHPNKIVFLLGNHDIFYMYYPQFQCSDTRPTMQKDLTRLYNNNKDCFQVAYQVGNLIATHAGITNSWYADFLRFPFLDKMKQEYPTLANLLNRIDQGSERYLLHTAGYARLGYGNGGITWADKSETATDMLAGFHQVVGHTVVPQIETIETENASVTYINVAEHQGSFYELDIVPESLI